MFYILLSIPVITLIYYIINSMKSYKVKSNVLVAFTGQMGSGKTFHAVKLAIKQYKKRRLLQKLKLLKSKEPIKLYSNIPILISKEIKLFGKVLIPAEWSTVLEREHLLMEKPLNEYSVILIDEISVFASQWDYNNPNCQVTFSHFLRFCRHYLDPYIIITAQSIDEILVDIRRKLSNVYHLSNMRRTFLFFYKVDVLEIKVVEEIKNIYEQDATEKFFFGLLPFKHLKKLNKIFFPFYFPNYDSRCYSNNYPAKNKDNIYFNWLEYKTNYFIDLIPTIEQVAEYKKAKNGIPQEYIKRYIDFLGSDVNLNEVNHKQQEL